MNRLPAELFNEIAMNATPPDLLHLCQTNTQFGQICSDPIFWRNKFGKDYPDYIDSKPSDLTYRQAYILLATDQARPKPIYLNNNRIGFLWLTPNMTVEEVTQEIQGMVQIDPIIIYYLDNNTNHQKLLFPKLVQDLWNDILLFDIVRGSVTYRAPREPDELLTIYIEPDGGPIYRYWG
jgi:hypothetical protein